MPVTPTTPEIKIKELLFLQIEETSLSKYTSRNPTLLCYSPYTPTQQDTLLTKLNANNIVSFDNYNNKVLESFGYLILKTIYGQYLDGQLLKMIKLNLYSDQTNLKNIKNQPLVSLTNDQMKKFIVQIIFELCFSEYNIVLDKKLQKNPVILQIMSLFLRCTLVKLGLEDASSYSQKLPTQTVVELLSDYFDLNYRKNKEVYMYIDSNIFLYDKDESIQVGRFGEQKVSQNYHQTKEINPQRLQRRQRNQSRDLKHNFDSLKNSNFSQQINVSDGQAPTPFFISEDNFHFNKKSSENCTDSFQIDSEVPIEAILQEEQSPFAHHYKISTPSVESLEDKLQFLQSPAFSDQALLANKNQNRFMIASSISENFFVEQNNSIASSVKDSQKQKNGTPINQCSCIKLTKLCLGIHSNIYSLTIQGSSNLSKSFDFSRVTRNLKNRMRKRGINEKIPILSALIIKAEGVTKTEESQQIQSPSNFSQPNTSQFFNFTTGRSNRSSSDYISMQSPKQFQLINDTTSRMFTKRPNY